MVKIPYTPVHMDFLNLIKKSVKNSKNLLFFIKIGQWWLDAVFIKMQKSQKKEDVFLT